MTRPPPNELHGIEKCPESSESNPMMRRFLEALAADIDEHPGRLKAVDSELLARINSLVGDVQIDLTEPLCRDDE